MMLGGYKDHRLLLWLHHVPEQVKQQRRLVVHTREEKRELRKSEKSFQVSMQTNGKISTSSPILDRYIQTKLLIDSLP